MIILIGPTSSGKTSLALKIANKFNGEIISADSRQIYRDMDYGTGKVPINTNFAVIRNDNVWQLNNVKVWGYDVCDPDKLYSASDFVKDAKEYIKIITQHKKLPIIAGGTGFYIESLLYPKDNFEIPPNEILRTNLESKPLAYLQKMLPKKVLKYLNDSDIKNKRRLIRKIEILEYSKEMKLKKRNSNNKSLEDNSVILLLDSGKELLIKRSDEWLDTIWPKLVLEVERLIKKGYKDSEPVNSLIYKEAKLFVLNAMTESEAKAKAKISIHKYIKRQITFFKRFKKAQIINTNKKGYESKVFAIVEQYIKR